MMKFVYMAAMDSIQLRISTYLGICIYSTSQEILWTLGLKRVLKHGMLDIFRYDFFSTTMRHWILYKWAYTFIVCVIFR